MRLRRYVPVICLFVAAAAGLSSQGPGGAAWPPPVQSVPPESPALSPAEAMKTFTLPPGYRLELVASEPLVQDPVVMDWDADGRIWAVEMPGFVQTLVTPEPNLDPIGRIVVLEDTDRDGVMDKRTVFADGLILARALKVLEHGVLVGEPPNLWLMHDTDGDLRADTRELITSRYGRREGRVEENANDLHWGLDNWLHTADSDIFLRLKNGKFEVRDTLVRGEWGVTHDDGGRIYRNTNEEALHVDLVPTPYYGRNPNLARTRGSYEDFSAEDESLNVVWPLRPNPGTNRAYQAGIDRADGTLAKFTSVCAPVIYRGDRLPAELYGNAFVAEPAANVVSRIVLSTEGETIRARKAYPRGEFIASTDERFRPVFLSNAPDGTLYVVDMYRGVIQQRADVTQYLRNRIVTHGLERPTGLGRIYRVVHETTRRDTEAFAKTTPDLVAALAHPNGWRRDLAQQLLVERAEPATIPDLKRLAGAAADWRTRLHALWTLDGMDAIEPATVQKALADESSDVRAAAVRVSERWIGAAGHPLQAAILKRMDDQSLAVRRQLAASLGSLPAGIREDAVASLLAKSGSDPVLLDAAISGVRGGEAAVIERLTTAGAAQAPSREDALTMLSATIVRGGQDAAVQEMLTSIASDARPAWVRAALLRGTEVALLGASPPGEPAGRRGAPPSAAAKLPCPTCAGGRAGPGGAYAFPRTVAIGPAADAERPDVRRVRLNHEPAAFQALARGGSGLRERAAAVLARVSWAGKPGEPAPVAPLTADEERRFTAGREVYRNVCQACHQPDGRGQDRIAAPLVGSRLALARADIPVRILLNGKEGSIGLMPPVGQVFTDDQIADVLTYIRREWGQAGSPVDGETVKTVRAANALRQRPWTDAELQALANASRPGQRP